MDLLERRKQATLSFFKYIEDYGKQASAKKILSDLLQTRKRSKRRRGWLFTKRLCKQDLIRANIREPILISPWTGGSPIALTKVTGYNNYDVEIRLLHLDDHDMSIFSSFRPGIDDVFRVKRTESYKHLLTLNSASSVSTSDNDQSDISSFSSLSLSSDSSQKNRIPEHYDPEFLDDPELTAGRHRTVVTLPSFISSINHYAGNEELKKDLNEQFRQMHPYIDLSISLSKIRNLKSKLLEVTLENEIEIATCAVAYALFEKLLLDGHVVKANRRICGACCLLLSVKTGDCKETDIMRLQHSLAHKFNISERDILRAEFSVFTSLSFALHLPQSKYLSHFERIFSTLNYCNFQEYLGERMYTLWSRDQK